MGWFGLKLSLGRDEQMILINRLCFRTKLPDFEQSESFCLNFVHLLVFVTRLTQLSTLCLMTFCRFAPGRATGLHQLHETVLRRRSEVLARRVQAHRALPSQDCLSPAEQEHVVQHGGT